MLTLGRQKLDSLTLLICVAVISALTALCLITTPIAIMWVVLAIAGAALMVYWAVRWEITVWAWLWVLSYGLLEWPEWRIVITGFFNLTVPRFVFVAAVLAFSLHMLLHRSRSGANRSILVAMAALVAYCAVSASMTGWLASVQISATAPYFRFLGSICFPFIMFFLVARTIRSQKQILWALVLLSIYGWYALYIGYLQFASIIGLAQTRDFIWPSYINDPTYGIHFGRARGAFSGVGPQAILLVLLFYVDLFLIRRSRGLFRAALVIQAFLIPPAIFFTGLRSAFLSFGLCGILWCLGDRSKRFGRTKLAIAGLVLLLGVVSFWSNLLQSKRETGGIAHMRPIYSRLVLAEQTWEMFKEQPIFGVGFGHFIDAQQNLERDPGSMGTYIGGALGEHNLFLNMVAETGIVGFAGIVLIFILIFRHSRQLYRKLPETVEGYLSRGFVVLFWVAMVNYLTDAMFRDTLWDVFANGLFWCFAGLIAGYNRLLEPQRLDLPAAAIAEG